MRKYKILLFVCFLILLFSNKLNVFAYTYSEKETVLNAVDDILNVYKNNDMFLLIYEDKVVYQNQDTEIVIDGKYQCHLFNNNDLYLIIKNEETKLLKIVDFKITKDMKFVENVKINKILLSDNNVILLGKNNESGLFLIYSNDLKEIKKHEITKNINLDIYDAIFIDNYWYLSCTKDAQNDDSEFSNVGNFGDTKTVLLRLNTKMKLIDTIYFNNSEKVEVPILLKFYNDSFYLTIKGVDLYHYMLSKDLENVYFVAKNVGTDCIFGFNGEFININNQDEFSICENYKDKIIITDVHVLNYEVKNGCLVLYYLEEDNLVEHHFMEYHINLLNDFDITFSNNPVNFEEDLNHTKYVNVLSYFSSVKVVAENGFTTNLPGDYVFDLKVLIDGYPATKISTKAKVYPYVNVVNNGVYKTGFNLYFLGNAKLDDNIVSNGYFINTPGNYVLDITDKDNHTTTYKFVVVDDYYIRDIDNLSSNITVCPNEEVYVEFKLNNDYLVDEVFVNEESYPFYQSNDVLKIKVLGDNSYKINNYTLEKIKVNDQYYDIGYEFCILTLKNAPIIEVVESETNYPSFKFLINDLYKTIKYIKFVYNNQDGEQIVYNYLKKEDLLFDGLKKKNGTVTCYICYDLGDGNLKEQKVITLDAKFKDNSFFSVDTLINNDTLKEISITLNEKSIKQLNNLVCCNENLTLNYNNKFDPKNIYISLVASLIIIIVFVVLGVIKRKKKRKKEIT